MPHTRVHIEMVDRMTAAERRWRDELFRQARRDGHRRKAELDAHHEQVEDLLERCRRNGFTPSVRSL